MTVLPGDHPVSRIIDVAALPPPPHAGSVLTAWTLDPVAIALVVALAAGYLYALGVVRADARSWPAVRTVCFLGGLLLVLYATVGFPGAYAHALLWIYALQVSGLLVVAPVLLGLGQPLTLLQAALFPRRGQRLARLMTGGTFRLLRNPAFGTLLLPLATAGFFFTAVLGTTLRHYPAYELGHLVLLLVGFVAALPLASDDWESTSVVLGAGIFLAVMELLIDAIPGIALTLRHSLVAPAYFGGLNRGWGPSPLHDQRTAGAILWALAEFIDLPFLALLVLRWIRADEREAARVDVVLDGAVTAAPGPARAAAAVIDPDRPTEDRVRPWWETGEQGAFRGRAWVRRKEED